MSQDHRTPGCNHVRRIYRVEVPIGDSAWQPIYCFRCHPDQVKLRVK